MICTHVWLIYRKINRLKLLVKIFAMWFVLFVMWPILSLNLLYVLIYKAFTNFIKQKRLDKKKWSCISRGIFCVQWFEVRDCCLFRWPSLFKLSFQQSHSITTAMTPSNFFIGIHFSNFQEESWFWESKISKYLVLILNSRIYWTKINKIGYQRVLVFSNFFNQKIYYNLNKIIIDCVKSSHKCYVKIRLISLVTLHCSGVTSFEATEAVAMVKKINNKN
jgi:hypothetical protein